jgi:hypothetical protein
MSREIERSVLSQSLRYVYFVTRACTESECRGLQWKREMNEKMLLPNGQPIPIMLIGTKSDLAPRFDMVRLVNVVVM